MLARSLSALGRHSEALGKLDSAIPSVSEPKTLYLERAKILHTVEGPEAALNALKSLAESIPNDFSVLCALSNALTDCGDLELAVNVAQQALKACTEKTPHNEQANLHLLIGQLLRQSGQMDQAIHHLSEAIRFAPDRLEPYLELGLARKERREYQQALQVFERATAIAPEDPRAPYQAGLALKESKDYKTSEVMLRRAVSLAPNDVTIRRQLAAVVALNLVHNPRNGRN
jgi:tetratricopeptide (TPR) repeat protein